ncbi:MAG: hypothetical protein AB8G22_08285 [Saprospiraceae bacterium]
MNSIQSFLLPSLFFCLSCSQQNNHSTENIPELKDSIITKTITESTSSPPANPFQPAYVNAKSGLNYRKSPKGEILGKFPLNTYLKVIERTKIYEEIKDEGGLLKGEWVGIEQGKDTVYVFDAFLSESLTFSDLQIYYLSAREEPPYAYINVSESYPWNNENDDPTILLEQELGKDPIIFSKKRKQTFLKKMQLSPSDTAFVFQLYTDTIQKFAVSELSAIATVNVYAQGDRELSEYDYEFSFGLPVEGRFDTESLVYIGKENPFQTGKIKLMIWQQIDNKFPKKIISERQYLLNDTPMQTEQAYKFTHQQLTYYLQELVYNKSRGYRFLAVMEADEVIYSSLLSESESTYLNPRQIENKRSDYGMQWTGEIFKGKSPILYGFTGESFGCPPIDFVDRSEPTIIISCDNRH